MIEDHFYDLSLNHLQISFPTILPQINGKYATASHSLSPPTHPKERVLI